MTNLSRKAKSAMTYAMNTCTLKDSLLATSKKTITRTELESMTGASDVLTLASALCPLVESGFLKPFKSASYIGPAGHRVYDRYRINAPKEPLVYDEAALSALHPTLLANGWLARHPEVFVEHQARLVRLSDWLWRSGTTEIVPVNERAFDIWRDEKALDASCSRGKAFRKVLASCSVALSDLHAYAVYDGSFLDYMPHRVDGAQLAVSENKTTWHSMRRLMFEDGQTTFFGARLDGVVFGSGNKVTHTGALDDYATYLGVVAPTFLYWGDIDRMGIAMLTAAVAQSSSTVRPFGEAYDVMAARVRALSLRVDDLPRTDDERDISYDLELLASCVAPDTARLAQRVLEENRRIPQEIVTITCMKATSNGKETSRGTD